MSDKEKATLDDVYRVCGEYIHKKENLDLIHKAAEYAEKLHENQKRKSGEPYFVHVVGVAYILAELHCGPSTIAAGFLHDQMVWVVVVTSPTLMARWCSILSMYHSAAVPQAENAADHHRGQRGTAGRG